MITLSTNSVGKDAFFREIHAGDTVQDMDGTKYTVDSHGGCKPLSGSGYTHLSKLKEPALVNGPAVPMPDGRVHTGPVDTSVPSRKEAQGKPSWGDMMSVAKNKSGFVALENMVRGSNVTGKQLRRILETGGVEVVTRKKKAMIRIEDRLRAGDLLRQAEKDPSLIPAGKPRKKPTPKVSQLPASPTDDWVVKAVEDRALWLRCLDECPGFTDTLLHNVLVKRGVYTTLPADIFPPPLPPDLVGAIKEHSLPVEVKPREDAPLEVPDPGSDADLANELRRRGYTVTATKHIEL